LPKFTKQLVDCYAKDTSLSCCDSSTPCVTSQYHCPTPFSLSVFAFILFALCCFSVIASVVIVTSCCVKPLQSQMQKLITFLSITNLLASLSVIPILSAIPLPYPFYNLSTFYWDKDTYLPKISEVFLIAYIAAQQYLVISTELWTIAITLYKFFFVSYPQKSTTLNIIFHLLVWFISLLLVGGLVLVSINEPDFDVLAHKIGYFITTQTSVLGVFNIIGFALTQWGLKSVAPRYLVLNNIQKGLNTSSFPTGIGIISIFLPIPGVVLSLILLQQSMVGPDLALLIAFNSIGSCSQSICNCIYYLCLKDVNVHYKQFFQSQSNKSRLLA